MPEEPLPWSAAPEEDTAALYEAAAESSVDAASANGNVAAQQDEAQLEANSHTVSDAAPADFGAPQHMRSGRDDAAPVASPPEPSALPYTGDTPDMLRWRAEMLMDEMMVGAVDASAGDQGGFFRQAPPLARAEWIRDEPPPAPSPVPKAANGANGTGHAPANGVMNNGSPRRAPTPLPAKGANGAASANGVRTAYAARPGSGHSSANGDASSNGIVGVNHTNGAVSGAVSGVASTREDHVAGGPPSNGFVLSSGIRGGTGEAPAQPPAHSVHAEGDERSHDADRLRDEPPIPPAPFRPPPSVVARSAPRAGFPPQPARSGAPPTGAHPIASTDPYSPEALAPADFAFSTTDAVAASPPAARAPNRLAGRTETAAPEQAPSPPVQPAQASGKGGDPARKLTAVEQRYPRSSSRTEGAARAPGSHGGGSHADLSNVDDDLPELGPIRRNPSVINRGPSASNGGAGSMVVANRNSRYAALLPRSTPWDVHEMEREIAALSEEMTRVLPPGHESARRARHLLDKAQTIFAADPQRSAEVDYYLSQVRTIVQRSRQTLQWAGLYRKRLVLYLMAWLVLSGIVVAASLIFGSALGERISGAVGWAADGWAANHVGPALLALYGGALGGSLGGMINLRRYLAHGVGFIDRKYSLRGLILPVMGMLSGAVLFGLMSGLFRIFAIPLNSSWLLELVPALLAFGLGFSQESIYGTRE